MMNSILGSFFILFLSIIFSIYYQNGLSQFNFKMIQYNNNYLFFIFVLLVSSVSRYYYSKDNSYLRRSKNKFSLYIFKYLSDIIHVSTLFVVVCSIMNKDFLSLDFHNQINLRYLGISISSIAITFFISSKISLGKNYSPCFDQRTPSSITTDGIYKFVRHPIYSSNILLMIGIFISTGSLIIAANTIILFAYYVLSAFIEERAIIKKFPKYKSYKNRTGMFIPSFSKMI